ncbi:hypothetical protein SAMN06265218_1116 [Fodinibius sediminis]|uniref:Uncharacterized protein n=1 Tax=Fodinibius sediminis TaxID=1214077 RepID=A0A521DLB2_9BACT|nr:hypothetical protein SAMN06265218_1116 [Fodinibius sediminis]
MKALSLSAIIGVVLGSSVIYWLELDEVGAIGLVLLLCLSFTIAIGNFISRSNAKGT